MCRRRVSVRGRHTLTRHLNYDSDIIWASQSSALLQTKVAHIVADSFRATHSAGGTVKCSEKSVPERFDFFATKPGEFATHAGVMHLQKMSPLTIAERNRAFRRTDYIREQHCRKCTVRLRM